MKAKKLIFLTLGLLLCATQGFATQYNNTCISSNVGETGQNMCFTICKKNSTTTTLTVTCSTSQMTNVYDFVVQNAGGGTFSSRTTPNISNDGHTMTFDINWSAYPSSSTVQIYLVVNRNTSSGGSDIMGCTITNIDCSASCSAPDTEAPVMTSASVTSTTHNSAVVTVEATDNAGVTAYVVKNGDAEVGTYTPSNNTITITGLSASSTYNYTVYAKDAAGNVSASGKDITITTTAAPAVDWSSIGWITNGTSDQQYTEKYKISGHTAVSVQLPEFATKVGIYMTFDNASYTNNITINDKKASYDVQGAGVVLHLTNFTAQETKVVANDITFYIYNKDGSTKTPSNLTRTSEASVTLTKVGETSTITHTTSSTGAITYESSNTDVATVDNGVITAVADGNATITISQAADATYEAGSFTVNVTVNIPVPVTNVNLNKPATSLYVGGTETLTATVSPDNATNKTVTWSSSDNEVATVTQTGVVTAVANGTATITATSNDDDTKSASCDVTVTTYVAPTYQESGTTDMSVGYVYTVQYNSDKSLTITITLTGNLTNMAAPVFYDTSNHYTMQQWSNLSSTYTTTVHYEEEQSTSNWYIKIPYEGGNTASISMSNYTVGADNTSCGTCFKVTF